MVAPAEVPEIKPFRSRTARNSVSVRVPFIGIDQTPSTSPADEDGGCGAQRCCERLAVSDLPVACMENGEGTAGSADEGWRLGLGQLDVAHGRRYEDPSRRLSAEPDGGVLDLSPALAAPDNQQSAAHRTGRSDRRRSSGPRQARVDKRKQAKHRNFAECLAAGNHG